MASSPIMHPRLLAALHRFYPATVAIQEYTATRATDGGEVKTWTNVNCLNALPCAVSGQGGYENKRSDSILANSTHRIAIAGYYSQIVAKMRAVSSGVTYDILAVTHDSQTQTTSLSCQVIT